MGRTNFRTSLESQQNGQSERCTCGLQKTSQGNKRKADYEWAKYQAIAIKHGVHSGAWDKDKWKNGWETIYHTNPDRSSCQQCCPRKSGTRFQRSICLAQTF